MKRIALISFMFPPMSSIGAMRPLRMAAATRGRFDCTVFCASPRKDGERKGGNTAPLSLIPNVKVITQDDGLSGLFQNFRFATKSDRAFRLSYIAHAKKKRARTIERTLLSYLQSHDIAPEKFNFVWMARILNSLEREHCASPFALVVASNPPLENIIVAHYFCQAHNIPLVLDFRDLFSNNPFLRPTDKEKIYERNVLNSANQVIAVTNGFREKISKTTTTPVSLIYNGFIEEASPEPTDSYSSTIDILYAGILYDTPTSRELLAAISSNTSPHVRFDFYGISLIPDSELPEPTNTFRHHGYISKDKIRAIEASADVILVIGIADHHEVIPAKTYEILSLRRPVIYIGSEKDEAYQILQRTGLLIGSGKSSEELKVLFENLVKKNLKISPRTEEIAKFSLREQSKQFIEIFEQAIT